MTGEQTLAELDALDDAMTRLAARRLDLLRHLDDLGHAREIGARDTVELVSLRHRLDPQTVRRDLRTAQALTRYSTVTSRLPGTCPVDGGAGDRPGGETLSVLERRRRAPLGETVLNPAQAAVIVDILDQAPQSTRSDDIAVAEVELVIAARTLLPRDLRRLGRGVLNALDPDGTPPADALVSCDEADRTDLTERAHAAQSVWFLPGSVPDPTGLPKRIRGLRIGGFLTGETAELLQVLVDAAAKPRKTPSGELDPRTVGQRRADAFGIILRAAASTGGEIPSHGGIKPHLCITVPYAALARGMRHGIRPYMGRDAIVTPVAVPGTDAPNASKSDATAADLTFGEPLSAGDARRLACDAGIIPIVLGAESEPLDVGREHRLVTPGLRRALIARDGGCVILGCGAPPGHCDAHHVIHWADGGPTAITNLALVCPPHHRAIHRGTWHLSCTFGRVRATPCWADPP